MTKFNIPDMTCGHCKATIEKAISALEPGAKIAVNLDAHTIEVEAKAPTAAIISTLAEAGYKADVAAAAA